MSELTEFYTKSKTFDNISEIMKQVNLIRTRIESEVNIMANFIVKKGRVIEMKKFIKDTTEIVKDIWFGFVWCVEVADELGEILGNKLSDAQKRKINKTSKATREVIKNCVCEG